MRFEHDRPDDEWQDIAERAVHAALHRGASYANVRMVLFEGEELAIEGYDSDSAKISDASRSISAAIALRVIDRGTWGFASANLSENPRSQTDCLVDRALTGARANSALQKSPVVLGSFDRPDEPYHYVTPVAIDPFGVSFEEKIGLLLKAERAMREVSPKVFKREASISLRKMKKILATSEGIFAVQEFVESGAVISAEARRLLHDDAQRRSYPDSHIHYVRGGWEVIAGLDLVKNAAQIAAEAEELLSAPYCPEGERDIILLPTMANLHCGHETIHGFEADRVLGTEWTLAGGSFITAVLPQIGTFRFGSEHVNIVADSTHPKGVATFACDDEGVPGGRSYLVKEGVLTGLLTSRETVPMLNNLLGRNYFTSSGGTMRAMDGLCPPLIRMVNILILPGERPFEEMKDEAREGTILFGTNKSWSIDDVRRHFNFGTEIAWEKVGSAWQIRKNAKYSGDNLTFFRNCLGFADEASFFLHGIGNCGKDIDPVQSIPTGHGTSPGWFANVHVGAIGRMASQP